MRKLLLTTSALALFAGSAFATDTSSVTVTGGSDNNDVAVSQLSPNGSQASTVTLSGDADGNDPITITQTANTEASSSLSIDNGDDNIVSVEQIDNAVASSSVDIKQASDGNLVGVSQQDNEDATASVLIENGSYDNNGGGIFVTQTENEAQVVATVNVNGSSNNHVTVEQDDGRYGEFAQVDLNGADWSEIDILQQSNFGAQANISVMNGAYNVASITQDGSLAADADITIDGSSNSLSIYQLTSSDLSAAIDVTGVGNTFSAAGGYSISQVDVNNVGLGTTPSASLTISGDDNYGGISQYDGINLFAEVILTNSNRNMLLVDQTGSDNSSGIQLDHAHDNEVMHQQSGSHGSATTTISNATGNVVSVSQM
jgi:hypothetical protein